MTHEIITIKNVKYLDVDCNLECAPALVKVEDNYCPVCNHNTLDEGRGEEVCKECL